MSKSRFIASGNLGAVPSTSSVQVNGEVRAVTNMRVYFDRRVPRDDGTFADDGGFWLVVTTWGRLAERCARLLDKGMRVRVEGNLQQHEWDEGRRSELRLTAHSLTLELAQVEGVQMQERDHAAP